VTTLLCTVADLGETCRQETENSCQSSGKPKPAPTLWGSAETQPPAWTGLGWLPVQWLQPPERSWPSETTGYNICLLF
jgi:hypothetical protein